MLLIHISFILPSALYILFTQLFDNILKYIFDNVVFDIIILLENLFDNAIEAVEKCANKKEIKFSIKNINSMLVLKLWNSSCKKPKVKKERFVTDKHDSKGHGWGLESVKYIVKKYDGIIEFEYTEMFFQTVIMIEGE